MSLEIKLVMLELRRLVNFV